MFVSVSHIVDIEEVGPCLAASIEWKFDKKRISGSSYLTICIIMVACSYISAKVASAVKWAEKQHAYIVVFSMFEE